MYSETTCSSTWRHSPARDRPVEQAEFQRSRSVIGPIRILQGIFLTLCYLIYCVFSLIVTVIAMIVSLVAGPLLIFALIAGIALVLQIVGWIFDGFGLA